MLAGFYNFIITLFLGLVQIISNIIVFPIAVIFATLLPDDFQNYFDSFNSFLTDYVIKGLAFIKEVILNATGYPRPLFKAIVFFFFARFTIMGTLRVYKFVQNIYSTIKTGKNADNNGG